MDGTRAKNIAEISTRNVVVKKFAHTGSGEANTVFAVCARIVAGGDYTSINGSSTNKYLTGLNPVTGLASGLSGICFLPYG